MNENLSFSQEKENTEEVEVKTPAWNQPIEEIKKMDKVKFFKKDKKKKLTFINKILMILGHGKKR